MAASSVGNIHIGLYVDVGDQSKFSDVANIVDRDSKRMNASLGNTTRAVGSLRTQMNQNLRLKLATESLSTLSRATDDIGRMRAALTGLAAVAGTGLTGALSATFLLQTADRARLLANQLKTVTDSTTDFTAVQGALFDVSQQTRSSFEATVTLYSRVARATEGVGLSQEKLLKIVTTVQKAFAIGGATTEEAQAAALQLSQGIASNKFGGDEYRSVAENAPVLLRGIAQALNVDIGKLRQMSTEGKLTAQTVTEAILKSADRINKEFAKTDPTVGQSITMIDNAFVKYIGTSDKAYGTTRILAEALQGLANNFEEVMNWVTKFGLVLGGLYVANTAAKKGTNFISGIMGTNADIRKQMNALEEQQKEIAKRRADIENQLVDARDAVNQTAVDGPNARFDQAGKVHTAKEKEYSAQQNVNDLGSKRNDLTNKLADAQNVLIAKAQKQVDIARQQIADDEERVYQAIAAAEAEERNLRARQGQRLVKADDVVGTKTGALNSANSRVAETEAAVAAERQLAEMRAQEEYNVAKLKKAGEIQARQEAIVTNTMRLQATQKEIAQLRDAQKVSGNLGKGVGTSTGPQVVTPIADWEKTFGKQYNKLLEDQQKVMTSTSKLRDQLNTLSKEYDNLAPKDASSKGLTTALSQQARALKDAQKAVEALSKAETNRNNLAAAPVQGKTLEARLADEQKALDTYQKSVDNLQVKMKTLADTTAGAFPGTSTQKIAKAIDDLDTKILAAQNHLKTMSANVAEAQNGNASSIGTALQAQAKAQQIVNDLEAEAANLVAKTEQNVNQLSAAQKNLNVLRRAGSSIVDNLGGWTNIGITAAIFAVSAAFSAYEAAERAAEERTINFKKELNDLGLLSDEAAGKIDHATTSLSQLTADAQREKLKELNAEIAAQSASSSMWSRWFPKTDPKAMTAGDIKSKLKDMMAPIESLEDGSLWENSTSEDKMAGKQLQDLIDKAEKGLVSANDIKSTLDTIAHLDISDPMNQLIIAARNALPYMKGLRDAVTEITVHPKKVDPTFRESENDSMTKLNTMNAANQPMLDKENRDNNLSDYQQQVEEEAKKLIAAAAKLGNTLTQSAAEVQAQSNIAAKAAKSGLLDLIGQTEGTDKGRGYNETLGYGKYTNGDQNLTQMTLTQILALQKQMLANPANTEHSSALGRYQITSQTLQDFAPKLGLNGDTIFSPEVQDRIAQAIIRSTGGDFNKLAGRWTSLKGKQGLVATATDKTFQGLPANDENEQKWIDGMKDLNLKSQIAALSDWNKAVVEQGHAMGLTDEQVQQYISAVNSGDLDKIPDKFKAIAAAMKLANTNQFALQLQNFKDTQAVSFLSDVDQQVVQMAQSFGATTEQIKQFVAAATSGKMDQIPEGFDQIRAAAQKAADNKSFLTFTDGVSDAVGGLILDLSHGTNGFKDFATKIADLALQMLVIEPIVNSLKTSFRSLGSGLSGAGGTGGGGLFSMIGKLFGFEDGGYTGNVGTKKVAGVVHGKEYVLDADTTKKIGVGNLDMIRDYVKTGRMPGMGKKLPGYEKGGYVADNSNVIPMPSPSPNITNIMQNSGNMVGKMADKQPTAIAHFAVDVSGARGNQEIVEMVHQGVKSGLAQYDKALPDRINQVNRNPSKR